MVEAAIFDMDGLLIDSQPLWYEAEIKILKQVGVPMTLAMARLTTGMRTDEEVQYWYQRYPWKSPGRKEIERQIDTAVLELIRQKGAAKPGVHEAVAVCKRLKLPMALASSSPTAIIEAVIEKLKIGQHLQIIHSAELEPLGKPHPDVYISTARKLGFSPENCVAFEDSVYGVISAKAAKMHCIAVPEMEVRDDKRYGIADVIIDSLLEVTSDMIQGL